MSSILQEIENQIAGVKTSVLKQNVGVVREIGDGVAKVEGLADAMYNEMLDFGGGVIMFHDEAGDFKNSDLFQGRPPMLPIDDLVMIVDGSNQYRPEEPVGQNVVFNLGLFFGAVVVGFAEHSGNDCIHHFTYCRCG